MAERGTYRRIADELRRLIKSAELPAGAMVPSESQLAEQYEVARGTVRSALAVLSNEGLIEVVPGQGRRVVGGLPEARSPGTAWERIADDLRQRIDGGEFGPSDPLPSEATLVADYGVSRNTVRRAYRHLVGVGAVVIRHGAGAFAVLR